MLRSILISKSGFKYDWEDVEEPWRGDVKIYGRVYQWKVREKIVQGLSRGVPRGLRRIEEGIGRLKRWS